MRKGLYAVLDILAGTVASVIVIHAHDAPAVRWFTDGAQDKNTNLSRHLTDHQLVCLGYFDEATGQVYDIVRDEDGTEVRTLATPRVVITGTQLAQAQEAAHNG